MQTLENFIDAVLGRDKPRITVEHGVIQSELMEAIYPTRYVRGSDILDVFGD